MVGQAPSPDIMMTSGDACPTNKGSLKVAFLLVHRPRLNRTVSVQATSLNQQETVVLPAWYQFVFICGYVVVTSVL